MALQDGVPPRYLAKVPQRFHRSSGLLDHRFRIRDTWQAPFCYVRRNDGLAEKIGPAALCVVSTKHGPLALLIDLGRRVLVIFTDGDDIASRGSAESARAALQAHDVILYMRAQGKAEQDRAVREQLTNLAESTGGRALFASRVGELADQFAGVVDDLSKMYVLAYSPERPLGDGRWRSIAVEPVNKDLRVRACQGYFAPRRGGTS